VAEFTAVLAKSGLSGDLFRQRVKEKRVEFEANEFKGYEAKEEEGFGVRLIDENGRTAFGTSNCLEELREICDHTAHMASHGHEAGFHIPSYHFSLDWEDFVDPRVTCMEEEEMVQVGEFLVKRIRDDFPGTLVSVTVTTTLEERELANHRGEELNFRRSAFGIDVSVNRTSERDILEVSAERHWGKRTVDIEELIQEIFLKLEHSQKIMRPQPGKYPVLFTPAGLTVLLIPLLFGLNGKNVVYRRSPLAEKLRGTLFSPLFNLKEIPQEKWVPAACPFDDEGIPTSQERSVIQDGKLEGYFLDLWSAARLGTSPSANGYRASFRSTPEPASAPLVVKNGLRDRETLVEEMEEGLIVDSVLGLGQSNIAAGVFSCNVQLGFWVKDGSIQGRVKDVMISGNAYQALREIREISRDNRWVWGKMLLPYMVVEPVSISS